MPSKRVPRGSRRAAKGPQSRPRSARSRPAPRAGMGIELSLWARGLTEPDQRRVRLEGAVRKTGQKPLQAAAGRIVTGSRPADLARLLAAIAHPQRIAVLRLLLAGEATHKALSKATGLKAGPLYYHIRELRSAGLIGPKVRDLYMLTKRGRRVTLGILALERLAR